MFAPHYPVVTVSNNKLTTTSKNLAEVFGKRHDDVLKAVRGLDVPEEFGLRNFAESSYKNAQGKKQPMVEMTRDGFTILVMGFTGPKAMKFKLAYIEAFNKMEKELAGQIPAVLDQEILKVCMSNQQMMSNLNEKLGILGTMAQELKHFNEMTGVISSSIQQLSRISNIENAVHEHIEHLRNDFMKQLKMEYDRNMASHLIQQQINNAIQTIKFSMKNIADDLESHEQERKGLMGYLEKYLPQHETGVNTTANVTPQNDPGVFINECCITDPFASVDLLFLYKVYKAWALSRFSQPLGRGNFQDRILEKLPPGVTVEERKSKRILAGIEPSVEDSVSERRLS
ncbi:MAG: Rha family transcriptional regulator [Smithella sp.]